MKVKVDDIQKQSPGRNEPRRETILTANQLAGWSSSPSNRRRSRVGRRRLSAVSLSLLQFAAGPARAAPHRAPESGRWTCAEFTLGGEGAARGLGCRRHVGGELESGAVSSLPGVTRAPWHPGWLAGPAWPSLGKAWPEGLVHRLSGLPAGPQWLGGREGVRNSGLARQLALPDGDCTGGTLP